MKCELKYEFVLLSAATIDGAIKADNSKSSIKSPWNHVVLFYSTWDGSLKNEATLDKMLLSLRFQCKHFVALAESKKTCIVSVASVWRILHVFVDFKIRVFLSSLPPLQLRVHFRQMNFNYDKINNLNFVTGIKQRRDFARMMTRIVSLSRERDRKKKHFFASVNWKAEERTNS